MTALRAARVVATLSVALFWAGIVVAGGQAAGYSARADVISNLASRGSSVAALGIVSILALVPAHLATAWVLRRVRGSRVTSGLMIAAAAATALIAVFRVSCSSGAAGCSEESSADAADLIHGLAVTAYALVIVAAMLAVAVLSARGTSSWPQWVAVASVIAAIGSVALLARTGGDDPGQWQRFWVATNLSWLLVVTWVGPVRSLGSAGARPPRR